MKKLLVKPVIKAICCLILGIGLLQPAYAQGLSDQSVSGEMIVRLQSGITPEAINQSFINLGFTTQQKISDKLNIWLFQYATQLISPDSCLGLLRSSNLVITAQFNHYVTLNAMPNDPGYVNQWGMNKVHAPEAWDITTSGITTQNDQIVIAIIDDGFDINHQDINYWKNVLEISGNGIDDDGNGYIDDYDGWNAYNNNGIITSANHGTHVAGIAGAIGDNSTGITGMSWNAKIMPVQASTAGTEAIVLAGYSYVLAMRELYNQSNGAFGAFVVVTNASFSVGPNANISVDDYPLWCGIYDALGAAGVLNVNAPKNEEYEIGGSSGFFGTPYFEIPAICSSDFLIVVTNTDENDNLFDDGIFNNIGSAWSTTYVDIGAPGTNIYSTIPGNAYQNETGTSMAAPHVAGAIALMYAAACDQLITDYKNNPATVALSIKQLILEWSDPISQLQNKTAYGRLNVYRSIINMNQQYDYDLFVTGNESSSAEYNAINDVFVLNYSTSGSNEVVMRAGNSINFLPGTILGPNAGSVHAFIDETAFACAVPFQPLSVLVISPEFPYCGGGNVPITCNAVPTGGHSPYSYTWFVRMASSTSWQIQSAVGSNIVVFSDEDFYIQVHVLDDRGYVSVSQIEFVNCIDANRILGQSDPTSSVESGNGDISESSSISLTPSDSLSNSLMLFPNPANTQITLQLSILQQDSITIQLADVTGNIIANSSTINFYEKGIHFITYNCENLAAGPYYYIVHSNRGTSAIKFLIIR